MKTLHGKIGELTLAEGFWPARSARPSVAERKAVIDGSRNLPLARELGISRGSGYYLPWPVSRLIWRSCGGSTS